MLREEAKKIILDTFLYDPNSPTGLLKANRTPVGTLNKGYYIFGKNGHFFSVHLIIWELINGPIPKGMVIDHIDRNKSNNNISNLRLCTQSQNACNRVASPKNKFGIKGLYYEPKSKRFRGTVKYRNNHIHFWDKDKDLVINWLKQKQLDLHKNFNPK